MAEYAPGMRTIIRDEEWMVRKVEIKRLQENGVALKDICIVAQTKKLLGDYTA